MDNFSRPIPTTLLRTLRPIRPTIQYRVLSDFMAFQVVDSALVENNPSTKTKQYNVAWKTEYQMLGNCPAVK